MRFCIFLTYNILIFFVTTTHASQCSIFFNQQSQHSSLLDNLDNIAKRLKNSNSLENPMAWRKETVELGLPGFDLPFRFGGSNKAPIETLQIFKHLGRYSLNLRDMVGGGHARFLIHNQPTTPYLEEVLNQVSGGKAYIAIAITEAQSGSDIQSIQSYVSPTKNGFILNGSKLYNARLSSATHVIILLKDNPSLNKNNRPSFSAFLLPTNMEGLSYTELKPPGLHGNSFGGVTFKNLFVPKEYLIGNQIGSALTAFNNHFLYWRLMMAGAALGTGRGALDQAAERLLNRNVFGAPIARFTHFQQELAVHTAKLTMVEYTLDKAAEAIEQKNDELAKYLVSIAKAEAVENALNAARFSMEVFGAEGYTDTVDLHQRISDLEGLRIADGTTHIMRQETVRTFYGDIFWKLATQDGYAQEYIPSSLPNIPVFMLGTHSRYLNEVPSDSRGGACATVTAFNWLQVVRKALGFHSYLNPDVTIPKAFSDLPYLRSGQVSDSEFLSLLDYFHQYLPGHSFKAEQYKINTNDPFLLETSIDTVYNKIFEYTESTYSILILNTYENEVRIGRHFVVLKTAQNGKISILDPNQPHKSYFYIVEKIISPRNGKLTLNLQSSNYFSSYSFEVESIITTHF